MADKPIKPIVIENPMGGWIPDLWAAPSNALQGGESQYTVSGGVGVHRKEKTGHIAPAEIFNVGSVTDSGSDFNSLPRAVAVDVTAATNNFWYITGGLSGTAPRLVKVTSGATSGSPHTITAPTGNFTTIPAGGTGFWGEDIIFYTGLSGGSAVAQILYSYNTSSDGCVGLYNVGGGNFVSDDFFSTTYFTGKSRLTAGVPHRMCEGPDKVVYITNGQYIASYDGSEGDNNGTYNPQALNLGAGWVGVDVCKYQNYIAIACIKNGTSFMSYTNKSESKVVLWDGFSLDFNFSYDAQDNVITALYNLDYLYAITQGRNGTTKIKYLPIAYGVSKLATLYENSTTNIGAGPDPRSMDLYNNNLVFYGASPNFSGAVSAFTPGGGFHQPYVISDGSTIASAVGVVSNQQSNQLYVGGKFGSTYKLVYLDGTGGSYVGGTWMSRLIELPPRSTIMRIKLYFSQFASASSVIVSLIKDFNSASQGGSNDLYNVTVSNSTYPEATAYKVCTIKKEVPDVSAFYLYLTFNHAAVSSTAAFIRRIEIEYVPSGKP